jgi:hypothetical protein
MFVTNHALSGVLIGRLLRRRPAAAFVAGVASHLVLDAIPHWGCSLKQPGGPERFLAAAKRDGLLGLTTMATAAFSADPATRTAVVAAMSGAVLLDLDKPLLHFFGKNPFPDVVQRIHMRIQNESPKGLRNEMGFGFAFAAMDAVAIVIGRRQWEGGPAARHGLSG